MFGKDKKNGCIIELLPKQHHFAFFSGKFNLFLFICFTFTFSNGIGIGFLPSDFKDTTGLNVRYVSLDIESIAFYFHRLKEAEIYIYINPNFDFYKSKTYFEPNIGIDYQGGWGGYHVSIGPTLNLTKASNFGINANLFMSCMMIVKVGLHYQYLRERKNNYKSLLSADITFGLHLPWQKIALIFMEV